MTGDEPHALPRFEDEGQAFALRGRERRRVVSYWMAVVGNCDAIESRLIIRRLVQNVSADPIATSTAR
jgi:hypothetical protein